MTKENKCCVLQKGSYLRCLCDQPEEQRSRCPGYIEHPGVPHPLSPGYCWYNYNMCSTILTDKCFRPEALTDIFENETDVFENEIEVSFSNSLEVVNMTYGDLLKILSCLNQEQLEQDVTIHIVGSDEYYPTLGLAFAEETDVLDEDHPFIEVSV